MKRTRQERLRMGFLFLLVCLFFGLVTARLVQLQVINSSDFKAIVDGQSRGKVTIPAERGIIYDRNGKVVANNVIVSSLYAYPSDRRELKKVVRYLEDEFDLGAGSAGKKYGLGVKKFRWIKRRLSDEQAVHIAATAPNGLYLRREKQRQYPYGTVGKQILGFTDIDNCGQAGIELAYDSILSGKHGLADICRDGFRNTYRVNETALIKPVPGKSFLLTVDWCLQEIVEDELRTAVEEHHAKSGMAVFIDCNNGDVVAAAHFDPEEKHPNKPVKLRPVTDQFEPGSVFKAITAAGLLSDENVNFDDSVYCENGAWRIGRHILHDDKEHEWLNFREVIELSSNIGVAKYAIEFGGENLFETAQHFGLGRKLNIGLPGETSGRLVRPSRWSDYNVAALAMGHSVSVTAMQMAAAFASIANGGKLIRPCLLFGEVDEEGYVVNCREPEVIERPLKKSSADSLKAFLRGVVENGTAEKVNSPVISIAGKTGTAQIPDPEHKCYFKNRYISSFAGFFPYEKPLLAGIVVLEDPQPIHYGGYTAGPAFRNVAERYAILKPQLLAGSQKTLVKSDTKDEMCEVPDLVGRTLSTAVALAEKKNLSLRCNADEGQVVWQFPGPDRLVFAGDEVLVVTSNETGEPTGMMDLIGLSIREVSAYLKYCDMDYEVFGNGRVIKQSVKPGYPVTDESFCRLECQPM